MSMPSTSIRKSTASHCRSYRSNREHYCRLGCTYVSLTFQRCFGSFSAYVNNLRLTHYDQYQASHPAETKESAAIASGFSSYNAYYRAQQKLKK